MLKLEYPSLLFGGQGSALRCRLGCRQLDARSRVVVDDTVVDGKFKTEFKICIYDFSVFFAVGLPVCGFLTANPLNGVSMSIGRITSILRSPNASIQKLRRLLMRSNWLVLILAAFDEM